MSKLVNRIVGARVQGLQAKDGSLHLALGALRLVIHNHYTVRAALGASDELHEISGRVITNVRTDEDVLEISFGAMCLVVDLTPTAWRGPEAAVLYENEVPLVVWS